MKNKFYILIMLATFMSCRTKKETIHTIKEIDSVYVFKTELKTAPIITRMQFSKLCDSAGNLRPINYFQNTGKAKIRIQTIRDTLYVDYDLDSVKQSAINTYKSSLKDEKLKETKVVYKPTKWLWYSLALNVLLLLFILRKYIPYLKLLPF